jgi:hypothetical protein
MNTKQTRLRAILEFFGLARPQLTLVRTERESLLPKKPTCLTPCTDHAGTCLSVCPHLIRRPRIVIGRDE